MTMLVVSHSAGGVSTATDKLSILDGDCDTGSNKCRLDVSRHVIGPLSTKNC